MPSYSPVYSVPFIIYTPSTPNNTFEVPDGFTAVVRDMEAALDIGEAVIQLGFQLSGIAPVCYPVILQPEGIYGYQQWQGRIVVPAGGFVEFSASSLGDSPYIYVGGYLLRNVLT